MEILKQIISTVASITVVAFFFSTAYFITYMATRTRLTAFPQINLSWAFILGALFSMVEGLFNIFCKK